MEERANAVLELKEEEEEDLLKPEQSTKLLLAQTDGGRSRFSLSFSLSMAPTRSTMPLRRRKSDGQAVDRPS